MEIMLSFNDLRKLCPYLCMAFKSAFTRKNRKDIRIPVSTAVLYFPGSILIMSQHALIINGYIPAGCDIEEGVVKMLRLPYLIGITILLSLIEDIAPVMEDLGKKIGRASCRERV